MTGDNSGGLIEALNACEHSVEVEPEMAGMRNELAQFKVITDGEPEKFIEEAKEIADNRGLEFSASIERDVVKMSPFTET